MNLRSSFAWWSAFKWRMPRPAGLPDFADMGTAFGLDASLDLDLPLAPSTPHKKGRPETGAPEQRARRKILRG